MGQKAIGQLLAHWDVMLEDIQVSPLSVYEDIEDTILSRALPGIAFSRVFHKEGGFFSSSRECMRVLSTRQ